MTRRSPTDRYVGLEFKGEVCGNDTDLEFVMLVEAVSVIVDTDILYKYQWDPFCIFYFLASALIPASVWFCIWWPEPVEGCPQVLQLIYLQAGYFSAHGQTFTSDKMVQEYKSSSLLLPIGANYDV